mgnify:CR=1 FL=1|jgi:hypothetical protein
MDKKLREEIAREVRNAMMAMQEQWLTADKLCDQFQMFTPDWLAKYGDILPRKKVTVTHLDGTSRGTRWAYARYEIAQNIAEGVYDDLKLLR